MKRKSRGTFKAHFGKMTKKELQRELKKRIRLIGQLRKHRDTLLDTLARLLDN